MSRPLALVTGGMRRLGAHIAAVLAEAGYDLAVTSRSGEPDAVLADALGRSGGELHWHDCDLAEPGAPEALIGEVAQQWGRAPDLLVNAAARFGQDDWTGTSRADLDQQFALNLFAPVLLTTALARAAAPGQRPAVVHIVDARVRNPNSDQLAYTLSKQALAASILSLAVALRGAARVNGVAPGLILANPGFEAGQLERVGRALPLGRTARPDEVAAAVLMLARAESVTGQLLYVDGGAHIESYARDFEHF